MTSRIKTINTATVGAAISCFCAFLFQISSANISCYVISMETVVNGINQICKSNKNDLNAKFRSQRSKINNSLEYSYIRFAICNECYWCASFMSVKAKLDGCPSCLGNKVRLIPVSIN
jgi:hypothetical protein